MLIEARKFGNHVAIYNDGNLVKGLGPSQISTDWYYRMKFDYIDYPYGFLEMMSAKDGSRLLSKKQLRRVNRYLWKKWRTKEKI